VPRHWPAHTPALASDADGNSDDVVDAEETAADDGAAASGGGTATKMGAEGGPTGVAHAQTKTTPTLATTKGTSPGRVTLTEARRGRANGQRRLLYDPIRGAIWLRRLGSLAARHSPDLETMKVSAATN